MKNLILALALLTLAPQAFAAGRGGNDGPQAVPEPKPRLVAELFSACGFFCPKNDVRALRIYANGAAVASFEQRGEPEKTAAIAQLSPEAAARLRKNVEQLKISALKDDQPGTPECMDAPGTVYRVVKSDGSVAEIRRLSGCHTFSMEEGGGTEIANLLDGFAALSPLLR